MKQTFANQPAAPYQPRAADVEAAKFLALMATRYTKERASRREVEEAIQMWRDATTVRETENHGR